jgi:hypothetical protein
MWKIPRKFDEINKGVFLGKFNQEKRGKFLEILYKIEEESLEN